MPIQISYILIGRTIPYADKKEMESVKCKHKNVSSECVHVTEANNSNAMCSKCSKHQKTKRLHIYSDVRTYVYALWCTSAQIV